MSSLSKDQICDACGGHDFEWMHECRRHNTEFCRGCSCPECDEESKEDDYGEIDSDD